MVYQFNPDMLPDSCFHAGDLKYIVPGNQARALDLRRTPLRVLEVKPSSGFFVVEILDFEDKGWRWELPFEAVNSCQFAQGSVEASNADVAFYAEIVARLDRPLAIEADPLSRAASEARIASLRVDVGDWLDHESAFLRSGARPDLSAMTGEPMLWAEVERYMTERGLWDIEESFADQYVRSFHFGEVVKGHRIVLAELGLVAFEGKQVRDPGIFDGSWRKQRRADHIVHRLAFVRELFERLGHTTLVLYRGDSYRDRPQTYRNSFLSATFNLDVAMSHFNERDRTTTGVLLRQSVPVDRLFMSFVETAQMNRPYKEAEAVLIDDGSDALF